METIKYFLLWCTIINYGILLAWFLVYLSARGWIIRMHGRWFHLSDEAFDTVQYGGMLLYKLGIGLFNLVPLIVIWTLC